MHTIAELSTLATRLSVKLDAGECVYDQEILDIYNLIAHLIRGGASGQDPTITTTLALLLEAQALV